MNLKNHNSVVSWNKKR